MCKSAATAAAAATSITRQKEILLLSWSDKNICLNILGVKARASGIKRELERERETYRGID